MSQEQEECWRVGPVSGKLVLVVEDDTPVGELLLLALAPETSYHPLLVSTEQEILRAVQEVKPVLVLLDYQLPQRRGIEVYDDLHARKELATVPAIVMSANVLVGPSLLMPLSCTVEKEEQFYPREGRTDTEKYSLGGRNGLGKYPREGMGHVVSVYNALDAN